METIHHQCTYEEVQLQNKAAELTDVIVKPNWRILSSFAPIRQRLT